MATIRNAPATGADEHRCKPAIEALCRRQIKNFLLTLFVSRGVPMLPSGDEVRRTQHGNNNAYCQDNESSWLDWTRLKQHQEIYRFARGMIALRCAYPILSTERFYADSEIRWLIATGRSPDWFDIKEKQPGCMIQPEAQTALMSMFNADTQDAEFELPALPRDSRWYLVADTSRVRPQDLFAAGAEELLDHSKPFHLPSRSSAICRARKRLSAQAKQLA